MSDDYSKLSKKELIELVVNLNNQSKENIIRISDQARDIFTLEKEIELLESKLTREQFSHEMTVEECEELRNDLLDARLESYAERTKKKFYIGSRGNTVYVKTNVPF